jgi:beta-glucosidase
MRKHLLLFLCAALPAAAAENPFTGVWTIESSVMGSNRSQTCALQQTGAQLKGSCVGEDGATFEFSGQAGGNSARWTVVNDWNGSPFTMAFSARLANPEQLTGSFETQPFKMTGTVNGTREAGGEAVYAAALTRSKTAGPATFPAAPPAPVTTQASAPLANPQVRAKVDALLAQMTLEEKVGQLVQLPGFPGSRPEEVLKKGGAGSILWLNDTKRFNELQRVAVEQSRLHIPLLFALDVIHGYRTIFPVPLAMAASWDPAVAERAQTIAAREARAVGLHWTFGPMVDIARDARWGRIVEGAGEDPFLGAAMAAAQVRGFQGQQLGAPDRVVACAKHFAGYGAAEGGRDYDPVYLPESQLRNVYLPPFYAAARAGVGTFMSAYMDLNDVPAAGNHFLLTEVLRKEWGFQGFVVSDAMAPGNLITQGFARQGKDAALRALSAGLNMDMASDTFGRHAAGLVQEGKLTMAQLDEAVRPILAVKLALNLFERPYADESQVEAVLRNPEHRQEARRAAQRTIVLLRNEKSVLPLSKDLTNVAVIGPLADSKKDTEGSWVLDPHVPDAVTVLEGIRAKLGPNAKISHAKGPEIKRDIASPFGDFEGGPKPAEQTPTEAEQAFQQAVATARASDTVVMVLGELADMAGESASRALVDLPGRQQELLEAVVALGKPVVLVLINGRPLSINWAAEHVPAILEAWEPGSEGGNAVADVLFGDVNPGGKLPVSFPRSGAHEPLYLAHNLTHSPESAPGFQSRYWDGFSTPLYPFGFGRSYTSFAFSNLKLARSEVKLGETVGVSVDVQNTGARAGDEVVQLYIHQRAGSASRPIRELKGFERVSLAPGEKRTVTFSLGPDELRYWSSAEKKWVLDAERFDVWAGGDSRATLHALFTVNP